jgi:glutamine synthetase
MEGLTAADAMVLFRTAVKAICQRRGLLASFMCWPALPNFFPCGWHLHQSLVDAATGSNAFVSDTDLLTALGRQFVAGLDGIERGAEPPPIVTGDPYAAEGTLLPQSLGEAVEALAVSGVYRAAFGDALIDYLVMMKREIF